MNEKWADEDKKRKIVNFRVGDYIVHRIPGRIRLRVPGIDMLDGGFHTHADSLAALLENLPAVSDVQWSAVTNNVLIHYDESSVGEADLLHWLERLAAIVLHGYRRVRTGENIHLTLLKGRADLLQEIDRIRAAYAQET